MRARSLKPGYFRNESLAELPFGARLLFAGLWCMADREGRLVDSAKRISADIFPYDRVPLERWLQELSVRSFIVRYEVDGTRYIQVTKWHRHQSPHVKEAPSTIPSPSGVKHGAEPGAQSGVAPSGLLTPDSGLLTPSSLTPDSRPPLSAESREREPTKTGSPGPSGNPIKTLPRPLTRQELEVKRQGLKKKLSDAERETEIMLNLGR